MTRFVSIGLEVLKLETRGPMFLLFQIVLRKYLNHVVNGVEYAKEGVSTNRSKIDYSHDRYNEQ